VLTGGNLFLAHTMAQVRAFRRILAATWIVVLGASGGLALPLIVGGLTARTLPQVLAAPAGVGPGTACRRRARADRRRLRARERRMGNHGATGAGGRP
jgi:hypothetical protein